MFSNRFAFVMLGMACVAAAAGGGYLATRQNSVPAPVAASAPASVPSTPAATAPAGATVSDATAAKPVQETETVLSATKSPAKRADAPVRNSAAQQTRAVNAAVARQEPPALPSLSAPAQQAPEIVAPAPRQDDRVAQEPPRAPEPPQKAFEELVVSSDSVIGLQTENRISSETARVEDRVEARVTRDVRVSDKVAIPAGSRVIGSVTVVERGGKFKDAARLCVRFQTLVLADGTRMPMTTQEICRLGEAPANGSVAKVGGGAVAGAILGAILGGGKGAAAGAAVGAGGGAAVVAQGDRSSVTLPTGSPLTVRVVSPLTVITEQK